LFKFVTSKQENALDINTCKLLAEYNKKTNIEMNSIIRSLNSAQWQHEFEGYFNSIKSLCNHIYICDFNWLKRFSKLRPFNFIKHNLFDRDCPFGTIMLHEIEDYIRNREALDEMIIQFVSEITQSDLGQFLKYTDSHNKEYGRLFGGLIIHFFNHQTHHRGMISIYLESLKIQNDFSNLSDMV
jgi:uncharacterized damage-inducible protein DinB